MNVRGLSVFVLLFPSLSRCNIVGLIGLWVLEIYMLGELQT